MSLVTRCAVCGTAFRVQPAQLAARGGKVRCGKCGDVFDGVAALVEEGGERLLLEPSPQLGLFDPSRRPPQDARPALDEAPLPEFMAEIEPRTRRQWPWTVAALAAAALLAAQATFRYRSELVAYLPAARAPLDAACRWLRCEVALPRRLKLLSIDSYEVRADPQRDGVIVLNAVIRNRAPFPQDYPALQLTLTDEATRHLVSRVLSPREYLDAGRAAQLIARGIDAGGETSLTVYLDASRTRATGYQLVLFYPT
ncbi:MAG TPA: DUF3426 domain-containing protein [Burkholderiales bacterium]|nr:DUF3426 domain-containing protein [Burkholderiales bacterium]